MLIKLQGLTQDELESSRIVLQRFFQNVDWKVEFPTESTPFFSIRTIVEEKIFNELKPFVDKKLIQAQKKKINPKKFPEFQNHYQIIILSFDEQGLYFDQQLQHTTRVADEVKVGMYQQFNELHSFIDEKFKEQYQQFVTAVSDQMLTYQQNLEHLIVHTIWGDEPPAGSGFANYQKALMDIYQQQLVAYKEETEAKLQGHFLEQKKELGDQQVRFEVMHANIVARQANYFAEQKEELQKTLDGHQDKIMTELKKHQSKIQDYFKSQEKATTRLQKIVSGFDEALKHTEKSGEKIEVRVLKVLEEIQARVDAEEQLVKVNFAQRQHVVEEMEEFIKTTHQDIEKNFDAFKNQLITLLEEHQGTEHLLKLTSMVIPEMEQSEQADGLEKEEAVLIERSRQFYLELLRNLKNTTSLFGCLVRGEAEIDGGLMGKVGAAVEVASDFIPVPFAPLVFGAIGKGVKFAGKRQEKQNAKRFLHFLGDETGNQADLLILDVAAAEIAKDYSEQLNRLDEDSIRDLVGIILEVIIKAAIKADKTLCGKASIDRKSELSLSVRAGSKTVMAQKPLVLEIKRDDGKSISWTSTGLFKRSGLVVHTKEGEQYYVVPKASIFGKKQDRHEKYGFHNSSLEEVKRANGRHFTLPVGQPLVPDFFTGVFEQSESDQEEVVETRQLDF